MDVKENFHLFISTLRNAAPARLDRVYRERYQDLEFFVVRAHYKFFG